MYKKTALLLAALTLFSWWKGRDAYRSVPPSELLPSVRGNPLQSGIGQDDTAAGCCGGDYCWSFRPLYRYDISAFVFGVSHKLTSDFKDILPADLGLLWGENASAGLYRDVTLRVRMDWFRASWKSGARFNMAEAANTHIATCDPAAYRKIRGVRMGDQVRLKGFLVEAKIDDGSGRPPGTWTSSTSRNDRKGGACELLYIAGPDDVVILKKGPALWPLLMKLSGLSLAGLIGFAFFRLQRKIKADLARTSEADF